MKPNFQLSERSIIINCISLALLFFLLDLRATWAIGGVFYVLVIILSLRSEKSRIPYNFAILVSVLTVIALLLNPPQSAALRVITNHLLVLMIVWIAAWIGVQNKQQQEERLYLAAIVDSSHDIIMGKDLQGKIKSWNKTAEMTYGYKAEEILGQPVNILVPVHKIKEENELLQRIKRGEKIEHFETIRRHKDGREISVSLTLSTIKAPSGRVIGISSIARDISEMRLAREKELKLKEMLEYEKLKLEQVLSFEEGLNTIFNIDKLIDFVVRKTAQVLEAQRCSLMFFDDTAKELRIKGHLGLDEDIVKNSRLKLGDPIAGMVAKENKPLLVTDIETDERIARHKGKPYQSKSFISVPICLNRQLIGVINVTDKISDKKIFTEMDLKILCMIVRQTAIAIENARLYRELTYLAVTDPLTNLNNYRYFTKALDQEIHRAQRYGSPLCLLMMDLNHFKEYNDTFGHLEGDELLKRVAHVLHANIRNIDIACRYAGDEFVIILPETRFEQAGTITKKLRKKIEEIPSKHKVTISIGIAAYHKDMSRHDFILRADTKLYEAKRQQSSSGLPT